MSAPGLVIPLTIADVALFRAWDDAVALSLTKPLGLDEMVGRLYDQAQQIGASARAAQRAFGAPFDESALRRFVSAEKAARFFEDYRDEVSAILRPNPAKRARRG